jgi:thiol-disulfide isomerase/thioredoxin
MRIYSLPTLLLTLLATPHLSAEIEKWTNLDGQTMEATFIAKKGDYVSFKKVDGTLYLYPYAKLNATDKARVDSFAQVSAAPTDTNTGDRPVAPAPSVSDAVDGVIANQLAGKLVVLKDKTLVPSAKDPLYNAKFIAFYYSAQWCPPCRGFTPELVATYKLIKAKHPEFEIIFISSDENKDAMQKYMAEYNMMWPALRFDQSKNVRITRRPENEGGIPNLVFMDANGKELSLSYNKAGEYRGPRAVLKDIKKHFKI